MPFNPSRQSSLERSEREPLTSLMELNSPLQRDRKGMATTSTTYLDSPPSSTDVPPFAGEERSVTSTSNPFENPPTPTTYKVYRRRFIGLAWITLLNIVVSWNWLSFAPVSTTSSQYFNVSDSSINWLSTGFLFAFVVASPAAVWMLNRSVKGAMVTAAVLMTAGGWVRYAGTIAGSGNEGGKGRGTFGAVLFGQLLIGLAQPFVLAAPTRFSDLWFTEKGRITATAVASLANPFGGALGQLINPIWATRPDQIPDMVLWVSILTTIVCLPTFFVPGSPPTPPAPSAGAATHVSMDFQTVKRLMRNRSFVIISIPFVIYVTAFNATSSLLNQILEPYGFSEDQAGIGGALLIVVGLVSAAITSPLLDRYKKARVPLLKAFVPIIGAMYLALVFTPGTRQLAASYAVLAILGAASFTLVPLALELLVEVTWEDAGPEVSSTVCWTSAQLGGALLILVMDALKGAKGQPPGSLYRALVLQAVFCCLVVPIPMALGWWGTAKDARLEAAKAQTRGEEG